MSRLRSAPATRSAARPAPGRQVMVPTARPDIYVALLGVALGAIVIGCLLLVLVLGRYDWSTKVSARLGDAPPAAALASLEKNPAEADTVRL